MGFDSMLIELQLAHKDDNRIRAIYNKSKRLPERQKMMQTWSDHIDRLKAGKSAVVRALHA